MLKQIFDYIMGVLVLVIFVYSLLVIGLTF